MTTEDVRRLFALSNQLAENLTAAVLCAEEIREVVRDRVAGDPSLSNTRSRPVIVIRERPVLNELSKRVFWKGRSAHLGNTQYFRILDRLARRPNQYVTHLDLMREVWENEEMPLSTVRSVVRILRQKLRDDDMGELADAIRGHNGRYMLDL